MPQPPLRRVLKFDVGCSAFAANTEPPRRSEATTTGTAVVLGQAIPLAHRVLIHHRPMTPDNPKKILLIDKEPGVTRLIKRALEKTGKYCVKEEHDSKFALNSAKAFQPDLILLDTATDGSDREQLAKKIQTDAELCTTPMVSMSSLKPESEMISGGILTGYSFFAAPVRVEEVLKGVEELLFGKD